MVTLEPGVIRPGLTLREEQLKILFGVEDWRTLKDRLEVVGVRGRKIGTHMWYSTTLIHRGMERLILDGQTGED